jgi:phosphatidylserine decarboxylase
MKMEYVDRVQNKIVRDALYGEGFLRFVYATRLGKCLNELIFKHRAFNRLAGRYWDSRLSRGRIIPFIEKYGIPMGSFSGSPEIFSSFNAFFTRGFKVNVRSFCEEPGVLCSPAEGKLLARVGVEPDQCISIKGKSLRLSELYRQPLGAYKGGTLLVFRLYLADYHRFHFFDSGVAGAPTSIPGHYYAVSPMPFFTSSKGFYTRNHRHITVFCSDHFGEVLMGEVGGFCVGSIVQTYGDRKRVRRGHEKGYFKFGGSTVTLLFKQGMIHVDEDILKNSGNDLETAVLLGTKIGNAL